MEVEEEEEEEKCDLILCICVHCLKCLFDSKKKKIRPTSSLYSPPFLSFSRSLFTLSTNTTRDWILSVGDP